MPDTALRNKFPAASVTYVSFDGAVRASTIVYKPDRYSFWDGIETGISRGAGLSYTAASFSKAGASVDHTSFNRILDWDSETGIVEVETGITLGELYRFALARGFFLPVQPGHPKITIGGCIGADAHGKNQFRDGTFISIVESLRLFHPAHGILELSRSSDPQLFALTCGGYGLTGNVLTTRFRLSPIRSNSVQLQITPVENIFDLGPILRETAKKADLVYSWHDFAAQGHFFGRGFVVGGSFKPDGSSKAAKPLCTESRLEAASRGKWQLPYFNRWTTPLFNRLYHASVRFGKSSKDLSLHEFLFPVYSKEVYFQMFGPAGFHEAQIVIPDDRFSSFVTEIKHRLRSKPVSVTLASAKLFRGSRELLRFTGDGICLALNFPRDSRGHEFASFLDDVMLSHGGWPNVIKDSRLSRSVVERAYPEHQRFREQLRHYDPQRIYRSALSERLEL